MKMAFFSFFTILSLSLFVSAGGGGSTSGNGGTVLVCPNGEVTFFDIFEAEKARGLTLNLGPKEMDPFQKVEMVLNRIPVELLDWRHLLLDRVNFFKAKYIIGDFELKDVPDVENIVIKPGCEIKQAVVQRRTDVPIDPIFYVSQYYWNKMDNDSKASLILHEIIYYDAIAMGHTNSIVTRSINSYLMAKNLPQDPRCLFYRILQTSGLGKLAGTYRLNREEDFWIDAETSIMNDKCVFTKADIEYGFFQIKGVRVGPIDNAQTVFPMEWGVSGLDITNPERPEYIHIWRNYEMDIGKYPVILAAARNLAWDETRHWGSNLAPGKGSPITRPGFIALYPNGNVKAASVKEMNVHLFGENRKVSGEVWFSMNQEISVIQFVPTLTFSFNQTQYIAKEVSISRQGEGMLSSIIYNVILVDGSRVELSEGYTMTSMSVSK